MKSACVPSALGPLLGHAAHLARERMDARMSRYNMTPAQTHTLLYLCDQGGSVPQREVVEHKGWATEEELMDYFAIGQCTPGVIAVNTATFIGQKHRGWLGGIVATLGVVFPSLVIISILAGLITNFSHLAWVQNAFAGIQVCVCVLIFNAVLKLLKKSVVDKRTAAIFLIVMAGSLFLHISPVWFVVVSAVVGILLKNLEGRAAK